MLRRALLCLALLAPTPALAHGRDDAPGQERKHHEEHERFVEEEADHRLVVEPSDDGSALLRILAPERAVAHVYEGRREVFSEDIPCSFVGQPNRFYRVEIKLPGATWEKKIELRRNRAVSLWVTPPAQAPQPGPTTQTPPPQPQQPQQPQPVPTTQNPPGPRYTPPPPAGPAPMSPARLGSVMSALDAESFSDQKLAVLRSSASTDYVTVAQLAAIVDHLTFGHDKVSAVRLYKDRLLDRENLFTLYQHFTFDSEKREVQQLFGQ